MKEKMILNNNNTKILRELKLAREWLMGTIPKTYKNQFKTVPTMQCEMLWVKLSNAKTILLMLTDDIKPQRGFGLPNRYRSNWLVHFGVFRHCEVVNGRGESQGPWRRQGLPNPFNMQTGCRPLLRGSIVNGFYLSRTGSIWNRKNYFMLLILHMKITLMRSKAGVSDPAPQGSISQSLATTKYQK